MQQFLQCPVRFTENIEDHPRVLKLASFTSDSSNLNFTDITLTAKSASDKPPKNTDGWDLTG